MQLVRDDLGSQMSKCMPAVILSGLNRHIKGTQEVGLRLCAFVCRFTLGETASPLKFSVSLNILVLRKFHIIWTFYYAVCPKFPIQGSWTTYRVRILFLARNFGTCNSSWKGLFLHSLLWTLKSYLFVYKTDQYF